MTTLEKIGALVGIGGGIVAIIAGLMKIISWVWGLIKASLRKELEKEIIELKSEVKRLQLSQEAEVKRLNEGQEKLREKHADIIQDLLEFLKVK